MVDKKTVANKRFAAMDSAGPHDFNFNEAVSLMVRCDDQNEIDYYWGKLSAMPDAEQCGWLKDKYGLSWQIVPTIMDKMMNDGFEIPEIRKKLIDVLFDRNIHYMKHCLSFIKDTPQQRYLNLLQESPQIIQRIPQHYIASYLGVTPVHLSRIKSKLAKKSSSI